MSERHSHIEETFIPEGLEFRDEYMHAALGAYRKRKRALVWKKMGLAAAILLGITAIGFSLLKDTTSSTQAEEKPTSTTEKQQIIPNDSSSTIDLDNDEGTFNKNRQSPAVESEEATQDLSTKAVDMGDPMSSGVGLPGQLSTLNSNLQGNAQEAYQSDSPVAQIIESKASNPSNDNNHQLSETELQENQTESRIPPTFNLSYLPIQSFIIENQLQPNRPLPHLPVQRWGGFVSIGTKIWADYGFGSGPAQLDPVIGMGISYKWRKRMSYQLSGQFFTISGIAAPYVSSQRAYGEGFSETTYRYHTDRFYHAGLSIGASYRLTAQHSFSAFAESTTLLTADNRIETGLSSSYESASSNEVEAKGYVQGFRTWQHSVGIGYEYTLGNNKSLGVQYRQGLTDITINSYFGAEVNRNSMLSLFFKLKLSR